MYDNFNFFVVACWVDVLAEQVFDDAFINGVVGSELVSVEQWYRLPRVCVLFVMCFFQEATEY